MQLSWLRSRKLRAGMAMLLAFLLTAPAFGRSTQERRVSEPSFQRAIAVTLKHEGAYGDDPQDNGGATNYGISLRFLKEAGVDVDRDGDVDADDVKDLTLDQAKQLYYTYFWERYGYQSFPSHKIAAKVFDLTVNMGPKQSHKLLQRAIRACGIDLKDDGVIGPVTRAALVSVNQDCLLTSLRSEAAGFYRYLRVPRFEKGWLRRAYS